MAMKTWKYRNNSEKLVIWKGRKWKPHDEFEVTQPCPPSLGLTCVQEGEGPDPVLCHEDLILSASETKRIDIAAPEEGHKVALSLLCIGNGGAECRFNSLNGRPIPVDARAFSHTLPWEFCSVLYLTNIADGETQISVSAVSVAH